METWKDIPGYEWVYQASNTWHIRSLHYRWQDKVQILSESFSADWYKIVAIHRKSKKVHRLVAMAFHPNPENKETVNHKDGNKENNNENNVEWSTRSENVQHAFDTGLNKVTKNRHFYTNHPRTNKWKFWQNHKCSKIVYQYSLSGEFIKQWYWWGEIQRELWIWQWQISACCLGKQKRAWWYLWKYINT